MLKGEFMKIENGRIVKATEKELFNYYLKQEMDDIYSFPEYCERMKNIGVTIIYE